MSYSHKTKKNRLLVNQEQEVTWEVTS